MCACSHACVQVTKDSSFSVNQEHAKAQPDVELMAQNDMQSQVPASVAKLQSYVCMCVRACARVFECAQAIQHVHARTYVYICAYVPQWLATH